MNALDLVCGLFVAIGIVGVLLHIRARRNGPQDEDLGFYPELMP